MGPWTRTTGLVSLLFASIVIGLCVSRGRAERTANENPTLRELAIRATGADPDAARDAIARLRAAGPSGLAALIDANQQAIASHRTLTATSTSAASPQDWPRLRDALDAVAAQKDAWASGLYWYTDLEPAKRAARETDKPILSLRLLGRLDTEFSCANSRFFRTVLYANAEVSKALSERFVLHWKSVRPVPKVTIDFGDGRIVERTITGNSIHYVLDADGHVIDGIPGLYGPKPFLRELNEAAAHAAEADPSKAIALQRWHLTQQQQILTQWQDDLRRVGAVIPLATSRQNISATLTRSATPQPPRRPRASRSGRASSSLTSSPRSPPTSASWKTPATTKPGTRSPPSTPKTPGSTPAAGRSSPPRTPPRWRRAS
jgi:hypothetical protein